MPCNMNERSPAASPANDPAPATDPPTEVARAVAQLVATLARAQAVAASAPDDKELGALLARARAELDVADEKLLALDRHRQRSAFRQAERIRARLDALEHLIEARLTAYPR